MKRTMPKKAWKHKAKKRKTQKTATSSYERQLYGVHVDPADCRNRALLTYYQRQGIVPSGEWAEFERVRVHTNTASPTLILCCMRPLCNSA